MDALSVAAVAISHAPGAVLMRVNARTGETFTFAVEPQLADVVARGLHASGELALQDLLRLRQMGEGGADGADAGVHGVFSVDAETMPGHGAAVCRNGGECFR